MAKSPSVKPDEEKAPEMPGNGTGKMVVTAERETVTVDGATH